MLSVISCLITPLGWQGLLFPFSLLKLSHLSAINEWMPYSFSSLGDLEIVMLAYLFLALLGYIELNPIYALIVVGLLHQALMHNRYAAIFGLIIPLLIAKSFGARYQFLQGSHEGIESSPMDLFFERLSGPASKKVVLVSGILILSLAIFISRTRHHESSKVVHPIAAVDFVKHAGISGSVLNAYEFGGYLIDQGIPVFIGGRADLYDKKILGPYLAAARDGFPSALDIVTKDFKISWVLIRPDSPAKDYFESRSQWKNVYEDKVATVFVLQSSQSSGNELSRK